MCEMYYPFSAQPSAKQLLPPFSAKRDKLAFEARGLCFFFNTLPMQGACHWNLAEEVEGGHKER